MDDVAEIREGRALREWQGRPGSAGWLSPFSGVGTHKATYALLLLQGGNP